MDILNLRPCEWQPGLYRSVIDGKVISLRAFSPDAFSFNFYLSTGEAVIAGDMLLAEKRTCAKRMVVQNVLLIMDSPFEETGEILLEGMDDDQKSYSASLNLMKHVVLREHLYNPLYAKQGDVQPIYYPSLQVSIRLHIPLKRCPIEGRLIVSGLTRVILK